MLIIFFFFLISNNNLVKEKKIVYVENFFIVRLVWILLFVMLWLLLVFKLWKRLISCKFCWCMCLNKMRRGLKLFMDCLCFLRGVGFFCKLLCLIFNFFVFINFYVFFFFEIGLFLWLLCGLGFCWVFVVVLGVILLVFEFRGFFFMLVVLSFVCWFGC